MTAGHRTDVLICGAGAAGLTLAIDLARRGLACRLIERRAAPFHGSRGKGIQPRTLEVFEDLGIVDRMAALGGTYPRQRVHAADGSHVDVEAIETRVASPAEPYGAPLMLPQFLTEQVMRERLCELGGRVEFGVALTGFAQDGDGVTATLDGPEGEGILRTRYLVGADGGHSTVRRLLGVGFPGKTLGVRALVADVTLQGLDDGLWHRFNEGDMARQISLCPLAGTRMTQIQAPISGAGDADLSVAGLEALVRDRTGRLDLRVDAVSWASAYDMNARLAERYRVGRVLLAGDAAHIHPPTGGQGLNTGVQDAYNLGWKLSAVVNGADPVLLDSYEAERRPIAADMLGLSTTLLDAAKRGDMRRGREVQQLDIGYGCSPVSVQGPSRGGLGAGDRAPDAPIRGAAGQSLRLFALLAGVHWTLLMQEGDDAVVARLRRPGLRIHRFGTGGDIVDAHGHFAPAYGLERNEAVLVRPDGYIAGVFSGIDTVALDALDSLMAYVGLFSYPAHSMKNR